MEQEAKLIYAVRATCGHRFVEFRQLQEVGIFSFLLYSLAKNHFYGWGFVKAWMAVFLVSKSLNQVKKIPTCVAMNSGDPRVSLFT